MILLFGGALFREGRLSENGRSYTVFEKLTAKLCDFQISHDRSNRNSFGFCLNFRQNCNDQNKPIIH